MIGRINQIAYDFNAPIIFDNGLILAIIAINMTVIGLTSLADKKTVIGVDYGEFLIKKFKFMKIRMYYWLILFALINVISLFTMFINEPLIRIINFILLIFSLIFAIVYFFRFILIENKGVVKQVYLRELLGLYCDSSDIEHFYVDNMVNMNPGTRTLRKLSTNIINYFNDYNGNTQRVFIEVFGPDSLIYSNEKSVCKFRKKYFNTEAYRYRVSPINKSVKEISFEFFQLFRFVEHQDRWALDILLVLNGDPNKYTEYDIYRLYNFARLTAQIRTFGISENLFKYKFLFHYRNYWYSTVNKEKGNKPNKSEIIEHIKIIEKEILYSLFVFISKTINIYTDKEFINVTDTILKEITLEDKYKGFLSLHEILTNISEVSIKMNCLDLQQIIEKHISEYQANYNEKKEKINIEELRRHNAKIQNEQNVSTVNKVSLF